MVRSHGWYDLAPFSWDASHRRLTFVTLESDAAVRVTVAASRSALNVAADGAIGRDALRRVVRRVLDLDADLTSFHELCRDRTRDGFAWIARRGAGRILRSPTLFEDAVKVLATTNCSWALTRAMVQNLIRLFGRGGAFPDASFLASLPEARLRQDAKMGYRATSLARFAESVAAGRLVLARWEDPSRPDEDVEREITAQHGFGPYAAETLARLLGRHARLGLDSWSRKKVAGLRFRSRRVPDRRIEAFYKPFGRHAGLAFWLDVTRDWHEG